MALSPLGNGIYTTGASVPSIGYWRSGGGTKQEHFMPYPVRRGALLCCAPLGGRQTCLYEPTPGSFVAANHWLVGCKWRLAQIGECMYLSLRNYLLFNNLYHNNNSNNTSRLEQASSNASGETVCVQLYQGFNCISCPCNVASTTQTIPFCRVPSDQERIQFVRVQI